MDALRELIKDIGKAVYPFGTLANKTGETLLVYGPALPGETFDNSLYQLPAGQQTPDNWDCDGFFVPNNRVVITMPTAVQGPVAVKYSNKNRATVTSSKDKIYQCSDNYEGKYKAKEINWSIPNIASSAISTYPVVPNYGAAK